MVVLVAAASACGGGKQAGQTTKPIDQRTVRTSRAPSADESGWLTKSKIGNLIAEVRTAATRFARTHTLTGDISSIAGGPGPCVRKLESAGRPPTARLLKVYRLTRAACIQRDRAGNQMLTYTLTKPNGQMSVHQSNPRAAAASMRRAGALAQRAQGALAGITGR